MNDVNGRFDRIWNRMISTQGEVFYTKTGLKFTHRIERSIIWVSRSNRPTMKADLKRVFDRLQIESFEDMPVDFRRDIVNSYIWGWLSSDKIVLDIEKLVQDYQAQLTVVCNT
jgi:hypothetical protein